jgi:SAM-dependent methyltransferase
MAAAMPLARFTGIDLSERQIETGRAAIDANDLTNVVLQSGSFADLGPDVGEFDFIIAHGVLSWVPRELQERLFAVCRERLAPDGVAYISFNTLPGWHLRGVIRDMMRFHTEAIRDPEQQAGAARWILDFVAGSVGDEQGAYAGLLRSERDTVRGKADWFLLHDHLEPTNDAFYLTEFVARAGAHGLSYLGDSDISTMFGASLSPSVRDQIHRLTGDMVRREQYLDFLRNRAFRRALLIHAGRKPDYGLNPSRLESLWVAAPAVPGDCRDPVERAVMQMLAGGWPQSIPFLECASRLRVAPPQLGAAILRRYLAPGHGGIELRSTPVLAGPLSDHPKARDFSRRQAIQSANVTNERHEEIQLSPFGRWLIQRLDGTRDRSALAAEVNQAIGRGELAVAPGAPPETALNLTLNLMARQSLLIDQR